MILNVEVDDETIERVFLALCKNPGKIDNLILSPNMIPKAKKRVMECFTVALIIDYDSQVKNTV